MITLNDTKIKIFKFITEFGDWIVLVSITLLAFIILKNKKHSIYILANLIISSGIMSVIKLIFRRERPEGMLVTETSYSYPSGHTFISLAFYGFIIYLISKSNLNKKIKNIINIVLIILILLVGTSRVYLNAHYPTDVLGGFLAAGIYLIIYIKIIEKLEGDTNEKKKKRKE